MSFPGMEQFILRTLEEQGEVRPPGARLAQEWFWQAACALQSRGLCVADQAAAVVRKCESPEAVGMRTEFTFEADGTMGEQYAAASAASIPARLRLLLGRWRAQDEARGGAEGSAFRQCALDIEEMLEEMGGGEVVSAAKERARIRRKLLAVEALQGKYGVNLWMLCSTKNEHGEFHREVVPLRIMIDRIVPEEG